MDIFYRITKDHYEIMEECINSSLKFFIDQHDSRGRRLTSTTPLPQVYDIFRSHSMHWVFIDRNQLPGYNRFGDDSINRYYEVGGCTLDHRDKSGHDYGGDYFLFIYLTYEEGERIRLKHDLKPLK